MSLHEECGVFGIISPTRSNVANVVYYGLYALQHRGQESAGIVVNDDGLFYSHKDVGLVSEVFTKDQLDRLPQGTMAVGHVRYGTTGASTRNNCQPIEVNHQKGRLAIAHNGNLSNAFALRNRLELGGAIFHTTSDTETIAYIVTGARLRADSIEQAVSLAMDELEGAYSLVLMSATKLIAVRDPHGFRPLCFGKTADGSWVVASESCALGAVGAEFVRDVAPGEMLVFCNGEVKSYTEHCATKPRKTCIFEHIYFARPDSVIDGVSVQQARIRAGAILAERYPVDADVVIGVPDSGLDAALGYAMQSGIPYGIGLIKNKYIGRTFISPSKADRLDKVRIKLSPVKQAIEGKRVVLIDDSIVRGTTSKRIAELLWEAGAKEIHMRISAPPFLYPCYYGTDIDSQQHLIACKHSVQEIADMIGVTSLGYLPIEDLAQLVGGDEYCSACFDGKYATTVPDEGDKNRFEQKLSEKKSTDKTTK
ncbi:MAG: amidophosphoribosyltransferase [Clostridia bacterium]|nr:amidophosphoribosyltransferase [Clostridia bacterium]MDY4083129.1 amidophosphoribosyltransferase [Eubacteriales bacterium]